MSAPLRAPEVEPRPGDPPITPQRVKEHGLSEDEYRRLLDCLGREPSWTELGVFSVMWSEHCSYKSSRVHLRKLPTTGPRVLQGPGENAGIVDVGDGLGVCFKMESHNHPSFIEPRQGAATGVGGILRDVFTMNARPIALLDSLRFGRPEHPRTRFLVDGVVGGISSYGNCIGVPTVGGELSFHPSYDGNILVNAMCVGLVPADRIFRGIAAGAGNPVLYVGSRTGRDGIHGATMASDAFEDGREGPRPTVQVGDPYTEKLLLEACLELMKEECVVAIQDMGAAGLTSSSVEMAGRGGTGLLLHVDRVPRREPEMTPYECLLSESQERMLVILSRGREEGALRIFRKWDLEAVVVGEVTDDGIWRIQEHGRTVAAIPVDALTDAAPVYERPYAPPADLAERQRDRDLPPIGDCNEVLRRLLAVPDIADKRWVYRQYDHMVRLATVVRPGAADAAVLRLPTGRSLALVTDCNQVHVKLDPFVGAQGVVAEACRNVACVGAEAVAATDCLNFGNPQRPEIMWEFVRAIEGLAAGLRELSVPVVSGNVSLYNETGDRSIHPTPTLGVVGLIERGVPVLGTGIPEPGLELVLLGSPRPTLSGSAYARWLHAVECGRPPEVHWPEERALHRTLRAGIAAGLVVAAHDAADGGLGLALAEMCIAGGRGHEVGPGLGAEVNLAMVPEAAPRELLLFGESHGCAWVAVPAESLPELLSLAQELGCQARHAGRSGGDRLIVTDAHRIPCVDLAVADLREAWESGFCAAVGLAPAPPRR
jgi:phosphoribosylformylglycinamidine synthase